MDLDRASRRTLASFARKLGGMAAVSAALSIRSPFYLASFCLIMTWFAFCGGILCIGFAVHLRQIPRDKHFNRWDESVLFAETFLLFRILLVLLPEG
jgi:hypothetical protein